LSATAAQAVVTTTNDTPTLGNAVAPPGTVTGSSQAVAYPCAPDDCPTAIADSFIGGFPTEGTTYGVFTTGNAAYADDANVAANTGQSWGVTGSPWGTSVYDWNTYRFDLVPATTSCLAFDFKFYSDEFPEFIGSQFNDAFIAQLGAGPAISIDPATGAISAPGNFAAGAGDMISVNESGPSATSEAEAFGTTYDGATALLTARVPVVAGATNSLFLSLFDQGDSIYDSAVFVDNIRYETIDPKKCKSLALDPAEGTIGVTGLQAGPKMAKNYSQLTFPVSCDLPPGPVSCTVSSVASFVPTTGRVVSARSEALLAGVALTKPTTTTIAPNTNGTITMKTTQKGIDAIKAAIKKPAKLKAKAKKLLKKAKELRAEGKIGKAQELEKKAAKLIKRAKKLARKPLGVVNTTITNPGNGISQVFKTVLKRP
jgi:hypothetical protein